MRYFVQYHNATRIGFLPGGDIKAPASLDGFDTSGIDTQHVLNAGRSKLGTAGAAVGNAAFLIVGLRERSKTIYYLWSISRIESVDADPSYEDLEIIPDQQNILSRPRRLNDVSGFSDFLRWMGNFGRGFVEITEHPFSDDLERLAFGDHPVDKAELVADIASSQSETDPTDPARDGPDRIESIRGLVALAAKQQRLAYVRNDRTLVGLMKAAFDFKCQFPDCDVVIETRDGTPYVEVAHVVPVSEGGRSEIGNLIVLCPNHHAEFDKGNRSAVTIDERYVNATVNGKAVRIPYLPIQSKAGAPASEDAT